MKKFIIVTYCTLIVYILSQTHIFATVDEDPNATKAKKTVSTATKIVDSDNDNIPDNEDECPNIPGLAITKGCPDNDGDKIPDHQDDCPTIFGLEQYKGCPDSDLDGIPDNKDVCPYEAGPVSNNGCPLPEKKDSKYIYRRTKVVDTINLNEERNLQIMRYERYAAELELKRQEYLSNLANGEINSDSGHTGTMQDLEIMHNERYAAELELEWERNVSQYIGNESILSNNSSFVEEYNTPINPGSKKKISASTTSNETKRTPVNTNKSFDKKDNDKEKNNAINKTPIPADYTPASKIVLSTVKIDDAEYLSHKPKLEALLQNMRFQDGRVTFADEGNFFKALSQLASYCKAYPEWKLRFHCYSNETDSAFRNKQLFSNRVYTLKQILIGDLHISADRLSFVNSISHTPDISNFISLEITTK
ncbi:MAG: thrombospondin type 3 repeat-containing protein [Prevotellaceae bacterium]|jgi:hypothetical protein|nr:thrombospondin type 3 repeat-containing protein [Prevotellaceae bacterium]